MTKHVLPFRYADLKQDLKHHVFTQDAAFEQRECAANCSSAPDEDAVLQAYLAVTAGTHRPRNQKRRRQTLPENSELRRSLWDHRDSRFIDSYDAETVSQQSAEQPTKHANSSPSLGGALRLLSPRDLKQVTQLIHCKSCKHRVYFKLHCQF
jgi:hypothetical protein